MMLVDKLHTKTTKIQGFLVESWQLTFYTHVLKVYINFQCRFLQFHPTVMLAAYVNSCFIIIRQNFFPESVKILVQPHALFPSADIFFANSRLRACVVKGRIIIKQELT
jgi:hypothetical protein